MQKTKRRGLNERGFSVPGLISSIILLLIFVFLFGVIQLALDQATINFANFSQSTLLLTIITASVIVMGLMVLIHPFQENQAEQQRRIGF